MATKQAVAQYQPEQEPLIVPPGVFVLAAKYLLFIGWSWKASTQKFAPLDEADNPHKFSYSKVQHVLEKMDLWDVTGSVHIRENDPGVPWWTYLPELNLQIVLALLKGNLWNLELLPDIPGTDFSAILITDEWKLMPMSLTEDGRRKRVPLEREHEDVKPMISDFLRLYFETFAAKRFTWQDL